MAIFQQPYSYKNENSGENCPVCYAKLAVFLEVKEDNQWKTICSEKEIFQPAGGYGKVTEKDVLLLKISPTDYGFAFVTLTGGGNAPVHEMSF